MMTIKKSSTRITQIGQSQMRVEAELLDMMRRIQYSYHNAQHVVEVHDCVLTLAKRENINLYNMELLAISAMGHDLGFAIRRENNESEGARITGEVMMRHGYSKSSVWMVGKLIINGTTMPQQPQTHMECILADADLSNLGKTDFFEKNAALMHELGVDNLYGWYEATMKLLNSHCYFTQSAQMLFEKQKAKNIVELKRRIEVLQDEEQKHLNTK